MTDGHLNQDRVREIGTDYPRHQVNARPGRRRPLRLFAAR
jgi:hypothetical protein